MELRLIQTVCLTRVLKLSMPSNREIEREREMVNIAEQAKMNKLISAIKWNYGIKYLCI